MSADGGIGIVIAEGRPLYRRGLAALLRSHPGWSVLAEEDSGADAVAAALRCVPAVVVLDLELRQPDATETTRRIVAACPGVGVLVLTRYDDDRAVFQALCAGALGHLDKGAVHAEVVAAVSAVANGEAVVGPGVARRIVEFFAGQRAGAPEPEPLTGREAEVLNLVAAGWSPADIAKVLVLTATAVRRQVTAVVGKLQEAHRPLGGLWDAEAPRPAPVPDGPSHPADRPRHAGDGPQQLGDGPGRGTPRRRGARRGRRR
jgi:DNA-binding NarL/FixJ family response regulator